MSSTTISVYPPPVPMLNTENGSLGYRWERSRSELIGTLQCARASRTSTPPTKSAQTSIDSRSPCTTFADCREGPVGRAGCRVVAGVFENARRRTTQFMKKAQNAFVLRPSRDAREKRKGSNLGEPSMQQIVKNLTDVAEGFLGGKRQSIMDQGRQRDRATRPPRGHRAASPSSFWLSRLKLRGREFGLFLSACPLPLRVCTFATR